MNRILCRPKSLALDKLAAATRRAVEINPENAREMRRIARTPVGRRGRIVTLAALFRPLRN